MWEVAQYVFMGGAVVLGGTGIVLLLTAGPKGQEHATETETEIPRFALTPHFSPTQAGLSTTIRF